MSKSEYIHFSKMVSKLLKIKCPKVVFNQTMLTKTQQGMYSSGNDTLYIRETEDIPAVFMTIAHELRHKWQLNNSIEMLDNYIQVDKTDQDTYQLQPAEIDANAYSVVIMDTYFGIYPKFQCFSPKVRELIFKRAKELASELD